MSEIYQGLRNEARQIGENNDCGVKALAVVTGLPYAVCHAALEKQGRVKGKGTYNFQIAKASQELGFKLIKIDCPYRGLRSLGRNLPQKGNFFIWVTRHYAGVRDGVIHDWSDGKCLRVIAVYQVIKADDVTTQIHKFEEEKVSTRTRQTRELYKLVHNSGEIVAKYKRFPTKIDKVIKRNGIIKLRGRDYFASEFTLKSIA